MAIPFVMKGTAQGLAEAVVFRYYERAVTNAPKKARPRSHARLLAFQVRFSR
jgi:hypothetical protein